MIARGVTPILNVSSFSESVAWFGKLGWKEEWHWGDPPTFGAVSSGASEIFLCQGGQGGRGKSPIKNTFGPGGDQTADKGVWLSIWVDDVDEIYRECMNHGLDVAFPPTDMEWNVREMHLRHPDGHVFRISRGLEED